MPRYILVDNYSGYIFGDTADYAISEQNGLTPVEACRLLDERVIGGDARTYLEHSWRPHDNTTGYLVYRADVNGSDAVPVVQDGQDPEMIEAVARDCDFVAFVECKTEGN